MATWPMKVTTGAYRCSDDRVFLDCTEAHRYEKDLGLAAVCKDLFGDRDEDPGGYHSWEILQKLKDHRSLVLTWLINP